MFGGSLILPFAGQAALLVLFLLFPIKCHAYNKSNEYQPYCAQHPSSCGKIENISYPFRLKGDPENCGNRKFQLDCDENNQTVLYLNEGKYYVLAINYNNHTIRLVDVGLREDNCSSLPLYSLTLDNFTYQSPYYLLEYYNQEDSKARGVAVFMSCENPVNKSSHPYVDINTAAGSCVMNIPKTTKSGKYSYVAVGDLNVSDVANLCTVEMVVMISPPLLPAGGTIGGNLSLFDIHSVLTGGFELRWNVHGRYKYSLLMDVESAGVTAALALMARTSIGMLCMFVFLIYKFRRRHLSMFDNIEGFLQSQNNLIPIRYSYSNINTMTRGFKDKLGEGGYGSVYKGKLRSGNLAAIKMLSNPKADGQEFINEVATIGRIHHVNVVQLIGYCAERSKRALVYDFMPNGSLEKYIFSQDGNFSLSCEQMYRISIGVARGIEYLHRGCNMQILHFDIKPHNILLDENFTPKVSDFGLARLYPTDESIVSLTAARGTLGYMAPELFYKNIGGVSYKADVYSFGMLLMEMAGRRRNWSSSVDSSQNFFPSWVYDQFAEGRHIGMGEATEEENEMVEKMMLVALWCIQMRPSDRPSMNKVVEMLEGNIESLHMPPKPFLYPQDMPAGNHGIDTNGTRYPNLSGACGDSIISDISGR